MILLAARLGLRASDICGLKFENIKWESNTIYLIQKKTKKKIEPPLLVEIANVIIDYLKSCRFVAGEKTPLPVISEVLGYTNTGSTKT